MGTRTKPKRGRKTARSSNKKPANAARQSKGNYHRLREFCAPLFGWIARLLGRVGRVLGRAGRYALYLVLFIFVMSYVFWSTDRDKRYRYLPEYHPICVDQRNEKYQEDNKEWEQAAILSKHDGIHNDEFAAINLSKHAARDQLALSCMLQKHVIPGDGDKRRRIEYYVSFLEFRENGQPAHDDIGKINPTEYKDDVDECYRAEGRVRDLERIRKSKGKIGREWFPTQFEALKSHLRCKRHKKHFVLAFVHGWRHNAMIGNEDVQRARVFAAYTKSFLEQRCEAATKAKDKNAEQRFCDVTVTLVYFGWRGNRIDESYLFRKFGGDPRSYGSKILNAVDVVFSLPTLLTIFDRKPVSERVAPSINNALYQIDQLVFNRGDEGQNQKSLNRMVTFGHSLGGNILAFGMKDELVARIRNHKPTAQIQIAPPFGDMVVLINPASEAENWTALQRAMRERIQFYHTQRALGVTNGIEDQLKKDSNKRIEEGFDFFSSQQKPIVVSLTAANTWPAGSMRISDCGKIDNIQRRSKTAGKDILLDPEALLMSSLAAEGANPRYDRDTHDFFPFFRGDLRPLAETFELASRSFSVRAVCGLDKGVRDPWPWWLDKLRFPESGLLALPGYWINRASASVLGGVGALLRNFPFMRTDVEATRTIGHLNPVRSYVSTNRPGRSAAHFGTTHELLIEAISKNDRGKRHSTFMKTHYINAADFTLARCGPAHHMLVTAKEAVPKKDRGRGWTATNLISDVAEIDLNEGKDKKNPKWEKVNVTTILKHGYFIAPIYPITRPNDPFWNIRVRDTGMQEHGGYDSYPLICFIQQLVMDDVTATKKGK